MTGWLIFAGIALLLWLTGMVRLRLTFAFGSESGRLEFRVLFLRFDLFRMMERQPKEKKQVSPRRQKKAREQPEQQPQKGLFSDKNKLLRAARELAGGLLGRFARHFTIAWLRVRAVVGKPDAADTAQEYIRLCAIIYNAVGWVDRLFTLKRKDIAVAADYCGETTFFGVEGEVYLRVWHILSMALYLLNYLIKKVWAAKKPRRMERKEIYG